MPDYSKTSALTEAAWNGDFDGVRRCLKAGDAVDRASGDGLTALINAATNGYTDIARLLIEHGADLNKKDTDIFADGGKSPLRHALSHGNMDIARLLIEHGAKLDSALGTAACSGLTDIIPDLLAKGAKIDEKGANSDMTALMLAADMGHEEFVHALLERGANPNVKDGDGKTALMYAADGRTQGQERYTPIVRALLAKGANPNENDDCGNTAWTFAANGGFKPDVVRMLEDAAAAKAPEKPAASQENASKKPSVNKSKSPKP